MTISMIQNTTLFPRKVARFAQQIKNNSMAFSTDLTVCCNNLYDVFWFHSQNF